MGLGHWGVGGLTGVCASVLQRMTQPMSHTFKCPPKYTVVFYSVCTEVKKLIKHVFIFGLSC